MIKLKKIKPLDDKKLEELNFTWHTDSDGTKYIGDELIQLTQDDVQRYYKASSANGK